MMSATRMDVALNPVLFDSCFMLRVLCCFNLSKQAWTVMPADTILHWLRCPQKALHSRFIWNMGATNVRRDGLQDQSVMRSVSYRDIDRI